MKVTKKQEKQIEKWSRLVFMVVMILLMTLVMIVFIEAMVEKYGQPVSDNYYMNELRQRGIEK